MNIIYVYVAFTKSHDFNIVYTHLLLSIVKCIYQLPYAGVSSEVFFLVNVHILSENFFKNVKHASHHFRFGKI